MAIYEYYCPTCKERFERRRPMAEAGTTTDCSRGHRAERTITAFALSRGTTTLEEAPASGCACGGNCSCGSLS